MFYIFGMRMFGQTDRVPGVFHVATRFFHICFVPLYPVKSILVLEEGTGRDGGIPIPMSKNSLAAAWSRGLAWAIGLIMMIIIVNSATVSPVLYFLAPLFVVVAIFLQCHPRFRNASYERANEICASLPSDGLRLQALVDKHFVTSQVTDKSLDMV